MTHFILVRKVFAGVVFSLGCAGLVPLSACAQDAAGTTAGIPRADSSAQNGPAPGADADGGGDRVPVLPNTYVLAPDDVLDIGVLGQEDFQRTVTVLPDGTISYVGVGSVAAAGKTVGQLKQALAARLHGQFRHPLVTISVRETHSRKVSVLGAVQTEGLINYRPGMRLLDAIASSGGLKQPPELTDVTLVTAYGSRSVPVNMVHLMVGNDMSLNVPLKPGDLVIVSPRDPEVAQVQVMGQVAKAGAYPVLPGGATVVDVLNMAGGPAVAAAMTHVQILHGGQPRTVNLRPLLFNVNDPVGQTRVFAGDVINVPLNDNKVTVVGEVRAPQIYTIPDGQTWTVFTALTTAGGPTPEGDKKRVALVRTASNGQSVMTSVNTEDLLHAKSGAADPVMRPGDILVVPKRNEGVNVFGALQAGLGVVLGVSAVKNVIH